MIAETSLESQAVYLGQGRQKGGRGERVFIYKFLQGLTGSAVELFDLPLGLRAKLLEYFTSQNPAVMIT